MIIGSYHNYIILYYVPIAELNISRYLRGMKKIDFNLLGPQFADSRQWYDDMTSSSNVANDNAESS